MSGSRWATAVFIVSADCSTNGSCISPEPKSSPTTFMPDSSTSLMICSGCEAAGQRLVEIVDQAVAVAVDDALAQTLLDGPAGCGPRPGPPRPSRPRRVSSSLASGS